MDCKKENWFKKIYSEQIFAIYMEFERASKSGGRYVNLCMNRVIKYTQFSIDDPKNNQKSDALNRSLEWAKKYKETPDDNALKKKLEDFYAVERGQKKETETSSDCDDLFVFSPLHIDDIPITVSQYDSNDAFLGNHTGTFGEVFDSIPDFNEFYYRVTFLDQNTIRERVKEVHFGIRTSCIGGLNFSIDETLNRYLNVLVKQYSTNQACIEPDQTYNFWFILNHYVWYSSLLEKLKTNTAAGLEKEIDELLHKFPDFQAVDDLKQYNKVSGLYLMILDDYNVCYLGQAVDIKARIMRHWSRSDYFTGTGVDLFKAFDTTRLYVYPCDMKRIDKLENQMVKLLSTKYSLNVLAGGKIDYLLENNESLVRESARKNDEDVLSKIKSIYEQVEDMKEKFIVNF